ncbi:RagB/SusD family nutrient uptake outer membrane protein [Carboxylicivirga sp. RSCT41]|uniref:RagB/SusD family nutrient uptake outer membrane protein n=1 Tax=Carboxylicivirga agarovorans TaxID=3417570 RepID=UPI003D3292F6
MKIKLLYIALLILLVSCEDFLEEHSQDLVVPQSVQDYNELLYGEAYMLGSDRLHEYLELMTDDVKNITSSGSFGTDYREQGYGYYAWQSDPEVGISGARNDDNAWEWYYHSILMCNIVINDVNALAEQSAKKDDLLAEAYFLRAWYYFMLVNLYGEPYEVSTADSDLGVPINKLTEASDVLLPRVSVAANYLEIENDLNKAIALFNASGLQKDVFRANIKAAYLLASRVALYQQKYDQAISYSNLGLGLNSRLYNFNNLDQWDNNLIEKSNPELLFTYAADGNSFYYKMGWSTLSTFCASDELINLFESNDLRKLINFSEGTGEYYPDKENWTGYTGVYGKAMRSAEFYLNRAEAYAEKGDVEKAMADINEIRKNRFGSDGYELSAANREEAILLVRQERRMELCFEDQRWFDLRRWGRPELVHVYMKDPDNNITNIYVLEENDASYTLPLPHSVTVFDKEIENIQRPDRNPVNK